MLATAVAPGESHVAVGWGQSGNEALFLECLFHRTLVQTGLCGLRRPGWPAEELSPDQEGAAGGQDARPMGARRRP